mmetsp:Transcript_85568/g.164744  ORF Transcript_85568/g.164744 Transcript_85568/m.164744 type:complete len:667 (-) Transcript_85568:184-2184(-)
MKQPSVWLAVFMLHSAVAVTPVQKVIQLLENMSGKGKKEKHEEQVQFAAFKQFCDDTAVEKERAIKQATEKIEMLKADIQKYISDAEQLTKEIAGHDGDISAWTGDKKAATKVRTMEKNDYDAMHKDYSESVDALQRAIGILEREMSKHGASMMQIRNAGSLEKTLQLLVEASTLTSADAKGIQALVQTQQSSDDGEMGAPDPAVYKGQSGGIIDTLGDLLDKAETQLADVRNKETASLHEFEMLKQSLVDQIKYETKELDEAKTGIAASNEKKATAQGDLGVTEKNLDEDKNALASLHHECLTKAQDYEAETKSRGEELTAIATAKKVISESTGGAADLSYGFSQTSFLQRSQSPGFQAVRFLRELAQQQRLPALAQLSVRMDAAIRGSDDPFAKVKGLIQDMLERLQKEAEADATEKAFCDKELAETRAKKDDKTTEIKKLSTKIDQMTSRSAQLKEEVAELQKGLSALTKAQAEMDKIRLEEKEAYAKAKVEMEEGIKGVQLGLKVLRDYYAKSDKAHAADEGGGAGVIGLLEVVQSDFSKGLIEMTSTEEGAQSAYDQQTKENEIEKATKEQDVKYKTEEATGLDKANAEATSDRAGVQEELDAVLEYLKGMEDRCIAKPESYEQRTARREAELAGLKKALSILESETSFMQKTKRTLRGAK